MALNDYILTHIDEEPAYLAAINRRTWVKQINPHMCSGHLQGRVLRMLAAMINPRYVLEIGTFTGYSALCFAEALAPEGCVDTIEMDDELEESIRENIALSPFSEQIHLHIGDALAVIPTLHRTYDLVFIDGDKSQYNAYYEAVLPRVSSGGFILADNTLWHGKVIQTVHPNDKQTHEIIAFNRRLKDDARVNRVILPVRDGLTIIQKK